MKKYVGTLKKVGVINADSTKIGLNELMPIEFYGMPEPEFIFNFYRTDINDDWHTSIVKSVVTGENTIAFETMNSKYELVYQEAADKLPSVEDTDRKYEMLTPEEGMMLSIIIYTMSQLGVNEPSKQGEIFRNIRNKKMEEIFDMSGVFKSFNPLAPENIDKLRAEVAQKMPVATTLDIVIRDEQGNQISADTLEVEPGNTLIFTFQEPVTMMTVENFKKILYAYFKGDLKAKPLILTSNIKVTVLSIKKDGDDKLDN